MNYVNCATRLILNGVLEYILDADRSFRLHAT